MLYYTMGWDGEKPLNNCCAIISVDTRWRDKVRTAYLASPLYDLVIFDEAHKLGARLNADTIIEAPGAMAWPN